MNGTINIAIQIAFIVLIVFFAIISLLAMYVFIRYGRTRSITILISLIFSALFLLTSVSAYIILTNILQ